MARNNNWHDDYWLLLMQAYLKKPTGLKPLYSRTMVDLSLELHVSPQALRRRMQMIARLQTRRIEHIWRTYSKNPEGLKRAVRLLRSMNGFGAADEFYEGVEIQETFEKDFKTIPPGPPTISQQFTPVALVLVLELYFKLTPNTMVEQTPEVQELARLTGLTSSDVVEALTVYQCCDPYLHHTDVVFSPLLVPCQQIWQQYAYDLHILADYANELREYYKK